MRTLKYLSLALVCAAVVSCKSKSSVVAQAETPVAAEAPQVPEVPEAPQQPEMLTGKTQRTQLQAGTFGSWFNPEYGDYTVDSGLLEELKPLLKDVEITVFMGTWCGDSKRETPRFYKILDAAGKTKDIELITVDRSKTTPQGLEAGKDIIRVPTLIFSKDGKELGRIVEYPIESLEADMLKILKGEPYKHAYAN
ncbi:TlpA family protein disulfide reductase [Leeuwenhoekiella sp. MAR_2009_132]|uniref:TlpA family protein disulfide reductase n=1 Tax=Leeuwenhoekiella sp. MAR_2009_132 TaxID=1392489 RepID=UPI0004917E9B|nr:thioredoxin family protein [Leeuwenhoekiella sp. MAR_2009_132]